MENNKKKRLRWKRHERLTGLSAIGAPPRGWDYHNGEKKYAVVYPFCNGFKVTGWYFVAGWDSEIEHKNTCNNPCATPEEAKFEAEKYVRSQLKDSAAGCD